MFDMPTDFTQAAAWLPLAFGLIMALAMLAYVILDGYDLGVGVLLQQATALDDKNVMIASIGPFWDANETWLVLGVGILLVAFPAAHGVILGHLYLPVALMLLGLTLRGVAFDFRVKARAQWQPLWNTTFFVGSLAASWAQGYMLGQLITGFQGGAANAWFSALIGFCLVGAYRLLGATWLIMKTEGALQRRAVHWAMSSLWVTAAGVLAISVATPWVSPEIFNKWFAFPNVILLLPIPAVTVALFWVMRRSLKRLPLRLDQGNSYGVGVPFGCSVGVFLLAFYGLAYSLFPWLVVVKLTIWQAASSPDALMVIGWGTLVVLPVIVGYTVFAYRVFWGKASAQLSY
ncbi:MAG: cytochrome d ubiquinol oxidase subunit II [Proteobacteria bacterium]|nr:cytochrome d ubiquinol oxidase subunit II [Pseudomonadota bacterium]